MNKIATLLIGSALTALIANPAFAAATASAGSQEPKPSVTSGSSPAPAASATPAASAQLSEPAGGSKAQAVKIGYIDVAKVAAESDGGKAAAAALKAKSGKLRTKIEAKQKQIEKQKAAIEAKLASLSAKERAAKGKEFQKKMEEYQKLVRASDEEMMEMQEKLTSDLYKTIKKAATKYATSHGYTSVLEKKAILYLADTIEPKDLTEDISASLNEKQQAK